MAVTTNTTNRRRSLPLAPALLPVLLLSVVVALLSAPNASAHAAYESSNPAFAEVLSDSPAEISITFTQELFRREGANAITLAYADSGTDVPVGEPVIANDDRHIMSAALDEVLEPGRYIVSWTNLSAEDGDPDSGSYPFYIARNPTPAEAEADRRTAAELLIVYPGDEVAEPDEQATPQRAPTVVRSQPSDTASLGAGPIIWLVAGGLAAIFLVGALGFHLGSRRRGA